MNQKSAAELKRWCAILAEGNMALDAVPDGWFTLQQIADARQRNPCTVSVTLRKLLAEGRAQKQTFRIRANTLVRPVAHYKLK
jgi:hypothetical protein